MRPALEVVETRIDDPRATRLLHAYSAHLRTFMEYDPPPVDVEMYLPPRGLFLLIERDGAAIACGALRAIGPDSNGEARIEGKHLWVSPEARGKGIGQAMVREWERRAAGLGGVWLFLDSNRGLKAANAMYTALGFEPVPMFNENAFADLYYRKRIA